MQSEKGEKNEKKLKICCNTDEYYECCNFRDCITFMKKSSNYEGECLSCCSCVVCCGTSEEGTRDSCQSKCLSFPFIKCINFFCCNFEIARRILHDNLRKIIYNDDKKVKGFKPDSFLKKFNTIWTEDNDCYFFCAKRTFCLPIDIFSCCIFGFYKCTKDCFERGLKSCCEKTWEYTKIFFEYLYNLLSVIFIFVFTTVFSVFFSIFDSICISRYFETEAEIVRSRSKKLSNIYILSSVVCFLFLSLLGFAIWDLSVYFGDIDISKEYYVNIIILVAAGLLTMWSILYHAVFLSLKEKNSESDANNLLSNEVLSCFNFSNKELAMAGAICLACSFFTCLCCDACSECCIHCIKPCCKCPGVCLKNCCCKLCSMKLPVCGPLGDLCNDSDNV